MRPARPVEQASEEGRAVWASEGWVLALGAPGRDDEVVETEPGEELVDKVELVVASAADGRVMPLPFAIVFAASDVHRCRAFVAWDAVARVKIEPDVADLQGRDLGHAKTADGGQSYHEAVPVVAQPGRAETEEGCNQAAVYGEE